MVLMLTAVAAILIGLLVSASVRLSQRNLAAIEAHERESLSTKSRMLAENHALALKSLVLDNAFGDVQRLIERSVIGDRDLVYGMFTSAEGRVWAFAGPGAWPDMPDPKAYTQIGLSHDQLSVSEPAMREADLFGEHVLEIALPVKDGTEKLGTLRYGLSTSRMQAALRVARAVSQHDIFNSLALSLCVALSAAAIAAFMSRRAAVRIAKPITDLASAAKALAAGNREVRVDIRSNDEVEELGDAFNDMVSELKSSYGSLEDLNRNLESKVHERTTALAGRNRDMRLVLDNVEEGFLTVTPDAVMTMEHSSILNRWFGPYGENTTFGGYLERTTPGFSAYFDLAWEAIQDGFLPLEVCVEQLPRRLEARGSTWRVRYTPILNSGKFDGMLVVIQDVTVEIARQRDEQVQREILNAFQRLMRDRAGFMSFHAEMTEMVKTVCDGRYREDIRTLRRVIHTIKGNAGMFGLDRMAALCHRIEDEMAETRDLPAEASIEELRADWKVLTDSVMPTSEAQGGQTFQVPREDVQALVASLDEIPAARHLAQQVENWKLEPIHVPLRRLAEQASELAKRFGKGDVQVELQAEMIRCDAKRWAPFWSDLVHVVRNAVDHGLETAEVRKALGKSRAIIRLKAAWEDSDLVVSIADNGRGVPFDSIRQSAIRLGLPHTTHDDLVAAVLSDGVSTAENVGDLSGRGLGMAVVRNRVESMGGRVLLSSVPGAGTTWTFRFRRQGLAQLTQQGREGGPAAGVGVEGRSAS
jgi:two-component system, chemotaxis family, sensor kinase CheA